MRKLLLAGVAMLGGTMGLVNVASAQLQTQYPYTPPTGSTPVAPNGGAGTYSTDIPGYGPPLAPGNMTVRLTGRLIAYVGIGSDSGRNPGFINGTRTNPGTATNTKLASYSQIEFARLYPSFDAVAANGLKYGAFLEIRQDNSVAPGGGVNGSISGAANTRGALYFRRETGYFGTDAAGFVRIGATDQPTSLFVTGTFENFDDGGWNGDPDIQTGNQALNWNFPDTGGLYTTNKIVYISPKFANLVDFGVSFEPNTGNVNTGPGNCSYANTATGATTSTGSGCDATSSTSVAGENQRRRNTLDGVARFRTAVGPVGVALTVGGMYGGAVQYNGAAPQTGAAGVAQYNGLAVFDGGAQVTFGGLAVGGHIDYGQFNNGYALQPKGGVDSLSVMGGLSYQFGSVVVGAQYLNYTAAGSWRSTNQAAVGRTQHQNGVAVGSTLTLAPGAYLFLSYLYGQKHQYGVDLVSGTAPAAGSTAAASYVTHNNTQSQSLILGTRLSW